MPLAIEADSVSSVLMHPRLTRWRTAVGPYHTARRAPATCASGVQFQFQRLPDDVGREAPSQESRRNHPTVRVGTPSSQPAGGLDLRRVIDGPERLTDDVAVDAPGGQLRRHQGGAACTRAVRYQGLRECCVVQIAQPLHPRDDLVDGVRQTASAMQLLANLQLAVRPQAQEVDSQVEGVRW